MESGPEFDLDPIVKGTDPYPHQNVTLLKRRWGSLLGGLNLGPVFRICDDLLTDPDP
jgi:hypothetical protein